MFGCKHNKIVSTAAVAFFLSLSSSAAADEHSYEDPREDSYEHFESNADRGHENRYPQHIHFSNQEIDIYEQTPDTVYKDADWPSRVEEYSDYLSK